MLERLDAKATSDSTPNGHMMAGTSKLGSESAPGVVVFGPATLYCCSCNRSVVAVAVATRLVEGRKLS